MQAPTVEIEACREAHGRMATAITSVTDSVARSASLLPGWTVGHVLTHLARNAEAMDRRVQAALRHEVVDQYPGGMAGRAAQIEEGATRPADELVADVVEWSDRLDVTFSSVPDDCWRLPVRSVGGGEHPVAQLPFRRWREVEVHLLDLDIGVTAASWSEQFVELMVPRLLAGVSERADRRALTAWMLGRGPAPELEPWG